MTLMVTAPRRTPVRRGVFLLLAGNLALILAGCGSAKVEPTPQGSENKPPQRTVVTHSSGLQSGGKAPTAALKSASAHLPALAVAIRPDFKNVASELGVDFTQFNDAVPGRFFLPEVMGSGVAWSDFDLDGRLDLFLSNGCPLDPLAPSQPQHHSRMYLGTREAAFRDVSATAHAAFVGYGQGCAVGDFDVDGFPDLYLANYGPNRLLHNNGDGTFSDVTADAGVGDPRWSSSAAWLDLDADGDLDLYVVNYMDVTLQNHKVCQYDGRPGYCGPGNHQAVQDAIYLSDGQGGFQDAVQEMGFTAEDGKGLAIIVADFNDDRLPEVYVANDMTPNFLFTRAARSENGQPESIYREIATIAGCATSGTGMNEASMGVACADFDNDGRLDLFLSHYYHTKNTIYRNLGNLLFDDDSRRTRIADLSRESLGFGNLAFDFDRDGDSDLFVANGHVLGPLQQPNAMLPQLLSNDGGQFSDLSRLAGPYFGEKWLGRSVAGADFDEDGDLDIAVTHLERPLALLRNDTDTHCDWLGIEVRTQSRIPAVGGMVIVQRGALRMTQPIAAGGSYLASGDPRILFGLGNSQEPVSIEVRWPSGRTDHHKNVVLNRYLRITSPE